MIITFHESIEGSSDWPTLTLWMDAERSPNKGELAKVDGREMRVLEVCQTGPIEVDVYLVPTYVKVP